jgi:hypothetical protein
MKRIGIAVAAVIVLAWLAYAGFVAYQKRELRAQVADTSDGQRSAGGR